MEVRSRCILKGSGKAPLADINGDVLRQPGQSKKIGKKGSGKLEMVCLADDREQWREWDACEWILRQPLSVEILVDQGLIDQFLERELSVAALEAACASSGQPVKLRRHPGYDHSYYFIQSFVDDHLRHHAATLLANSGQ